MNEMEHVVDGTATPAAMALTAMATGTRASEPTRFVDPPRVIDTTTRNGGDVHVDTPKTMGGAPSVKTVSEDQGVGNKNVDATISKGTHVSKAHDGHKETSVQSGPGSRQDLVESGPGLNQDSAAAMPQRPRSRTALALQPQSPRIRGQQVTLSAQLRLDNIPAPMRPNAKKRVTNRMREVSAEMFGSPASDEEEGENSDEEYIASGYEEDDGDVQDGDEEDEVDDSNGHNVDEEESASNGSESSIEGGSDDDDVDDGDGDGFDPVLAQDCPRTAKFAKFIHTQDGMVRVTPPLVYHKNWKCFAKYLIRYSLETQQVLPIKENMNYREKNRRIKLTKLGQQGRAQLIPRSWRYYQKVYICTHGWTRDKRGAGKRPQQHTNATGCPFRFVVQMQPAKSGGWFLMVKNGLFVHNHKIDHDTYATYPVARSIKDQSTNAEVRTMIAARTPRTSIYDFVLERGENLYKRDIDNLVQQHRATASGGDEDEATAFELSKFAALDGNTVTVDETQAGETGVISMTSAHMRAIHARFPELLLIDTTHKTNRHNYQLLTFMAMDEYGEGRVVQHSLVETNSDWHMHKALDHFFSAHENTKLLRVIVVDKDLNEIRVLQKRFEDVRILICTFHVVKYLSLMCRKPEFGKQSQEDLAQLEAVMHKMIYAKSADEYNKNLEDFRAMCTRLGNGEFLKYFETNWNTQECKPMWVYYLRADLPHFGNHTNNRLENFFGKLKNTLPSDSSMPECVRKIVAHGNRVENEYKYSRNRLGTATNQNYDKHMSTVLRFTTHYIAELIEPEYAGGLAGAAVYEFERRDADVVVVRTHSASYSLNTTDYRCDCDFAKAMLLPCRHAIAYNLHHRVQDAVIPLERIDDRWRVETPVASHIVPFRYHRFDVNDLKRLNKKRTRESRFNTAKQATERIASELADISDEDEYGEMLQFILNQWRNVRQRKRMRVDEAHSVPGLAESRRATTPGGSRDDGVNQEMDNVSEDEDGSGAEKNAFDRHDDDDAMEPTQDAQWSQAHSLYSEELGSVSRVNVAEVQFQPTEQLVLSQPQMGVNEIAQMKIEKERKLKGMTKASKTDDVVVRLNRKASRPGRPSMNPKKEASKAKIARKRATAAQYARDTSGEVTLVDLAASIDRDTPGMDEIARRLSGLKIRHDEFASAKPTAKRQRDPVLNSDAFYLLPSQLLNRCIKALGVSNRVDEAINVASDALDDATMRNAPSKWIEIVSIRNLGSYSREQIETMKRLEKLKETVESGKEMCKWLTTVVAAAVDDESRKSINEVEAHIRNQYPARIVPGLGNRAEYCFSMLYRVQPPTYLNDAIINAACQRLCDQYPRVRHAGTPDAKPGSARTNHQRVPKTVEDRVKAFVDQGDVDVVAIPVNFGNSHWGGIIVDVIKKQVLFYDSLNHEHYVTTLKKLSVSIKECLRAFSVVQVMVPIQFDSFSCGVFLVFFFFNHVSTEKKILDKNSLAIRRWELLHYVLLGHARDKIVEIML